MVTGNIGTLDFSAGLDDYWMFTSFEQGADGVYTFIGEFKKENAQSNAPRLRFEIRDAEANPAIFDIEQALMQSFGFYNSQLSTAFDTTFSAHFSALSMGCPQNLPATAFVWDFGDNETGTGYTPTHIYANEEDKNVQLTLNYGNNELSTIEQSLIFDSTAVHCGVQLSATFVQNNLIQVSASGIGVAPFTYLWSNGATDDNITFFDDSLSLYSLTITDGAGCTAVANGNASNANLCSPGFTYSTSTQIDTLPPSPQFSAITIIYVDENGTEFRSDLNEQTNGAFFTIQNAEDFQNNGNSEKTKKLNIDFSCQLFSTNANNINVESTGGIIGIAYPD